MADLDDPVELSWQQVLGWRLLRQFLHGPRGFAPAADSPAEVAQRLAGIQAQVPSAADLAVGVRSRDPVRGAVDAALERRRLVRTWAMRGTLHVLPTTLAPAYLSLMAATRSWEKPAWQRTFATAAQVDEISAVIGDVLSGQPLTREELVAGIISRTGDPSLTTALTSGWGALLKPLAWQGLLVHGPPQGNRITFTSPPWTSLPDPDEAAITVLQAYLGAYGPASPAAFGQWLSRGATSRARIQSWFDRISEILVPVDVEGERLWAREEDMIPLVAASPPDPVRLLPAFDQYVLGPGTASTAILDTARRPFVSRAADWISPVVISGGRIAGVWDTESGTLSISWFAEAGPVPGKELEAESERIGAFLGEDLTVTISTI
ncbi:MAG: winged helix DNA-binding protein [Actinomycetia bacterium]|nr:winged helix DNA-binding protein [Actinomycetes bacterium]